MQSRSSEEDPAFVPCTIANGESHCENTPNTNFI